ncbi:lipopolysaccharide assembly protein LapB [Pontibacter sp. BAB1700]|uniref:tetratricopeptide repeat protein n=1 Tax=Pontibacter sp. BAB1700 TaxID=1144253 RepID=UPI00026BC9F7|nr:tetratricopeptide repeat protein [Pontibacter sp. BAB1700]EJF09157.1 outer membrane protein [Pontibacter sp. BAB1700]
MLKPLLLLTLITFSVATSCLAQGRPASNSRKAVTLYYKAEEAAQARDFNKALTYLDEAIERDPKYADAYLKIAHLHRAMGNKPEVFENLQKGLALKPFNAGLMNSYFDLADLYFERATTKTPVNISSFSCVESRATGVWPTLPVSRSSPLILLRRP